MTRYRSIFLEHLDYSVGILDSSYCFGVMDDASTGVLGLVDSPEGWGAGQSTYFDLWLMHSLIYETDISILSVMAHTFYSIMHNVCWPYGLILNLQNMILMQNRQMGIPLWQWFPQSPHGFVVCTSDVPSQIWLGVDNRVNVIYILYYRYILFHVEKLAIFFVEATQRLFYSWSSRHIPFWWCWSVFNFRWSILFFRLNA
jgi:hypothetical protein